MKKELEEEVTDDVGDDLDVFRYEREHGGAS